MSVASGDVVRAACRLRDSVGKYVVNVYHWRYYGGTSPDGDVTAGLLTKLDDMYANIQPGLDDGTSFVDVTFQNVTTGALMGIYAWPTLVGGGATGDGMPSQDCLVATCFTLVSHVFGRKFFGPFIEAGQAAGLWTSGDVSATALLVAEWLTPVTVTLGDLRPGVARYVTGGLVSLFNNFIGGVARATVRAQRRRQYGRGA